MTTTVDFTHEANLMFNPTTPCKAPSSLPYTPSRSSPLSSCPQNTANGIFSLKMLPSPPSSPPDFLTPKRLFKPVPIFASSEKGREARRDLFLKKVRKGREDKIMKSRGGEDEMMRLIFVSEQKRWEATQARAAATISTIYEEEEFEIDEMQDYELPDQTIGADEDEDEDFDQLIEREGEELEAMLSQLDLEFNHVMIEDPVIVQGQASLTLTSSVT